MSKNGGRPGLVAAGLGWGLALGLALGILVIAPAMVSGDLGADTQSPSGTSEEDSLAQSQVAAANGLLADSAEEIVEGALENRSVLVIRTPDSADADVDKLQWLINSAGADNAGEITLTEKFTSQESADELSTIITSSLPAGAQISVDNRAPGTHAGEALGTAVSTDGEGKETASTTDRAFLLQSLAEAGFIEFEQGSISAADAIVVVAGAEQESDSFSDRIIADFGTALASKSRAVVLSAPGAGTKGPVAVVREATDSSGKTAVDAVDVIDTEIGRVSAVLQLREKLG